MTFNLPSLRSVFQPTKDRKTNIDSLMDDFFNFSNQFPRTLLTREEQDFYRLSFLRDGNPSTDLCRCFFF